MITSYASEFSLQTNRQCFSTSHSSHTVSFDAPVLPICSLSKIDFFIYNVG